MVEGVKNRADRFLSDRLLAQATKENPMANEIHSEAILTQDVWSKCSEYGDVDVFLKVGADYRKIEFIRWQANVKATLAAVEQIIRGQRYDNTQFGRAESIAYIASSQGLSDAEAEDYINKYKAEQAEAILTAAENGQVKLSKAQYKRLDGM